MPCSPGLRKVRRLRGMIEELIIATHNEGKAKEIAELLEPYVSKFTTAKDLGLDDPEETGTTFEENALIKARATCAATGKVALADDSGLAVNALDGAPGIYSARWAELGDGSGRDFTHAMQKVHSALSDSQDRSAAFVCVLALVYPDGREETFFGTAGGHIVWPPRGKMGFGYDPIFVPHEHDQTFAEMDGAAKKKLSHRSHAFEKLRSAFLKEDAAALD